MSRECYNYQRKAKSIAKDLGYPESIITAISKATTENEISRIMTNARVEQMAMLDRGVS